MQDAIETAIPGRAAIELVSFYEEFRSYYPQCEMETKRWFVEHVRPDWWICDVGANVGYYSILFAQLAPNGRVHAFEPTATAAMLRKNLEHHNAQNIEVHEVALGAVTGLYEDRIYRMWGEEGEVQTYPFYKLDDFLEERKIERIDCIKIDVDSFDFEVLRGAEKTLQKQNPFIVIELNHALSKRNQSAGEALAWLAHRGYERALVLDNDNFVLHRGEDARFAVSRVKKLELMFPPPMRFNESLNNMVGTWIVAPLLVSGRLQNGARWVSMPSVVEPSSNYLKSRSSLSNVSARIFDSARKVFSRQVVNQIDRSGNVDPILMIGSEIETSAEIWSYALTLEFDSKTLQSLSQDGLVAVEVAAEVTEGKLGIALGSDDSTNFCAPERTMVAMAEVQRMIVTAPVSAPRFLILRNVAPVGTKTVFRLLGIRAKSK